VLVVSARMETDLMNKLEHLLSTQNRLGEGPRWHPVEHILYWVDIESKQIHRFDPVRAAHDQWSFDTTIGCLAFREQGGLILATGKGFQFWKPGESPEPILDPEAGKTDARFNDGAVDPQGRFWAGTIASGASSALYRLDSDLQIKRMIDAVTISNGIGWSPDGDTMYFTDTLRYAVYAFDFDGPSGEISNRRVLISTEGEEGVPDGLAVDREGCIWSARWGGWKIVRYDPLGRMMQEIPVPVQQPTSCTFGGPDFKDLYITSAWTELSAQERSSQPHAGDLFRLQVETPGLPVVLFAG